MRTDNNALSFRVPQLTPSNDGSEIIAYTPENRSNRFVNTKKLIDRFSQKLMNFLCESHEPSVTDWIIKDKQEHCLVGELQKTEEAYPPHIIAFRDFIHFLTAVSENLDLFDSLLTVSSHGLVGAILLGFSHFTPEKSEEQKKRIMLFDSRKKLQESIGAIKKLPIHNGIIDGVLYLYEQLSKRAQGERDDLTTVIQAMKDALCSSELLQRKYNDIETDTVLLKGKISHKAKLEIAYWTILLATSDTQRINALNDAKTLGATTLDETVILKKITEFANSPAWDVQRLTFLEQSKQNLTESPLTPEKSFLYLMQLKSIIGQIIKVTPEFMAEDNDAGNMLRMIGTLQRLPVEMIRNIDQAWFTQVMTWLHNNYCELCKDEGLKKLVESIYNVHTNFLADLEELQTILCMKFGMLTHDISQKLGDLKPKWLALSDDTPGPTEQGLRDQAKVWAQCSRKQAYFLAQQRIDRRTYQLHLLEKSKEAMKSLLEASFLQYISQPLQTLNVMQLETLKKTLFEVGQKIPKRSSLGKYIAEKCQEIEAEIERFQFYGSYSLGFTVLATRKLFIQTASNLKHLLPSYNEERVIKAAIEATEAALKASLTCEDSHLKIAWDTYQAGAQQFDIEKVRAEIQEYSKRIEVTKEKLENHSLEDTRAQQASSMQKDTLLQQIESQKRLSELQQFFAHSEQELAKEKANADLRLKACVAQNSAVGAKAEETLKTARDVLSQLSQMRTQNDHPDGSPNTVSAEANQVDTAEKNPIKEQGIIEQLLKQVDSAIKPLADHIANNQLYTEQELSTTKPRFDIRKRDARWISQLKHAHNILVNLKLALSKHKNNLEAKRHLNTWVITYGSAAVSYVQLVDSLLKQFSRAGDILAEIDDLTLHVEKVWVEPLRKVFLTAQKLISGSADGAVVTQAQRQTNSEATPQTQVPLSRKIIQDFQELLVELPSNLPERRQLDRDLTDLSNCVASLLGKNKLTIDKKGYELYDSNAFKRIIDLISKISAFAGSDFVNEKLSSYRTLLTEQLSAALQHALSEEIRMGYRAGAMTESLYHHAECLADYGLVDMPALYVAQLSYLNKRDLSDVIKTHFDSCIERLLKSYAKDQTETWKKMRSELGNELTLIDTEIDKIDIHNISSLISTAGKDLATQRQSLELRKAKINYLIVAKDNAAKFLTAYAGASSSPVQIENASVASCASREPHASGISLEVGDITHKRKALLEKYAKQEKVLTTLNRIVRQFTAVKWDIYYYEFAIFKENIVSINELIGKLEQYIALLATKGESPALFESCVDEIESKTKQSTLPP